MRTHFFLYHDRSRMIFRIGCISFIWIFLFVSWEYDRNQIALAAGEIPQQAVRLRILAHSDAPYDQWLKNRVRDEIIAYVESGHLQLTTSIRHAPRSRSACLSWSGFGRRIKVIRL